MNPEAKIEKIRAESALQLELLKDSTELVKAIVLQPVTGFLLGYLAVIGIQKLHLISDVEGALISSLLLTKEALSTFSLVNIGK